MNSGAFNYDNKHCHKTLSFPALSGLLQPPRGGEAGLEDTVLGSVTSKWKRLSILLSYH